MTERIRITEANSNRAAPRVCPKCFQMWRSEEAWHRATVATNTERKRMRYTDRIGTRRLATIDVVEREHVKCGGIMLGAGELIRDARDVAVVRPEA